MGLQHQQILAEEKVALPHVLTETVTPQESAAIIALWNQEQQETDNSTKLADVAEALNLPPEQAHRLLEQVRTQKTGQSWLMRTLSKNPLTLTRNAPSLNPWVSIPSLLLLGLGSYAWTFFSFESWISFAPPAWEKAGFVISDASLWYLVVQLTRSVYQDTIARRRKQR